VASAPGGLVSEYGRLCHGEGGHGGGSRRRSVLMFPTRLAEKEGKAPPSMVTFPAN